MTSGKAIYARIMRHALVYRAAMVIAVISMIVAAGTDTAFAALMRPLLDGSFVEKDPSVMVWAPILLIVVFLLRSVATFVSTYMMAKVGRGVVRDLRKKLFEKLIRLPTTRYDNATTSELLTKITSHTERVVSTATNSLTVLVRDSLTGIGLLAWMLYLSPGLFIFIIACGPPIGLLILAVSRRIRRLSHQIQDSTINLNQIITETVEGHQVVKTFGGQEYELERFDRENLRHGHLNMKRVTAMALSAPLIELVVVIALALMIALATQGSFMENLSVGTFVSFITAMVLIFPPIRRLTKVSGEIQQGIAAGESIFALMDEAAEPQGGERRLGDRRGRVEYRQLSFVYPNSSAKVLDNISFVVEPSQTVALVGRSGGGKSTLASLLPRFYDPESGQILIDGIDIRELDLEELRGQIAYVGQQVTLFNDSVAANIAYGRLRDYSIEQIRAAAEAAHALKFIEALPKGFDTEVGQNGVLLSGGQRQRIAIARAILKDAPILILDEATSSLDTESERHVQAALEQLMRERTTLVIAHRLSTVEHADQILVLDHGVITEHGTHHELIAASGSYAMLLQGQFSELKSVN